MMKNSMDSSTTIKNIHREYQAAMDDVEQKRRKWVENPTDKGAWGDYCFALGKEEAFEKAYIMVKKLKTRTATRK